MGKRQTTYVAAPTPTTEEGRRRYLVMQRVQAGELTVSEGAKGLGMSRVRFQTLLHRGLAAMVAAVEAKAAGRPPADPETRKLRRENEKLRRQTARMQHRLGQMEEVLELAADLMSRRIAQSRGREPRSKSRGGKGSSTGAGRRGTRGDDEEPERNAWKDAEAALAMKRLGLRQPLVAALLAVSARTLRRWSQRISRGQRPWGQRGPSGGTSLDHASRSSAEDLVRRLRGLIGADSIRHTVPGISRRQAAAVKAQTLTVMERERKQASCRVVVTRPGVMRGFDAIYIRTTDGWRFPLVAADAAVPFRTSATVATEANTDAVRQALIRDFEHNGAPLVLRLDRARAHDAQAVVEMLEANGILALHGPPHCARYYGQLERQNREHRAWLETARTLTPSALDAECEQMIRALSFDWRRPTLAWRTAADVWHERTQIDDDRDMLREETYDSAAHLVEAGVPQTLASRLAIEKALTIRGYLRLEPGTEC